MGPCDFTVGCGDSDCTSYYVNDDQVRLAMLGTGCIPSGKHTKSYGKSPFFMGKLTISMAMFNSFLYVYQRVVVFSTGTALVNDDVYFFTICPMFFSTVGLPSGKQT